MRGRAGWLVMTDADRKRVEKRRPVAAGTCLAGAQGPGKGTVPWFVGRVGRRLLTPNPASGHARLIISLTH